MKWFHKKDPICMNSEPPFPLDKPNSCRSCRHVVICPSDEPIRFCKFNPSTKVTEIIDGKVEFRTWDTCDMYERNMVCKTCKHLSPSTKIVTLGDEKVTKNTMLCDVFELSMPLNHCCHCWEAKE